MHPTVAIFICFKVLTRQKLDNTQTMLCNKPTTHQIHIRAGPQFISLVIEYDCLKPIDYLIILLRNKMCSS